MPLRPALPAVLLILLMPIEAHARAVTLPEVIARAHALRGAEPVAQVAEARAMVGASSPALAPRLLASRTESPPHKHLSLEENLGNVMTHSAERSALRADVLRARADSARTALDLERIARLAFFHALAARESLRLAGDEASLADSLADVATTRHRAGDISELERDQARLEAMRVRQDTATAEGEARAAAALLAATIAWTDPDPPEPVGDLADALDAPAAAEPALATFPELRAAVADSTASAARLRAARRARLPWPDLEVGMEWDDPESGNRPLSVIGVGLTLGWGQAGSAASAAQARARIDASRAGAMRYEAARVFVETRARRDAAAARAREGRDRILPLAQHIRERAVRSYRAGETSLVAALEAIRAERQTAFAVVADLTAFQEARADWDALARRTP